MAWFGTLERESRLREAHKLGLLICINEAPTPGCIKFAFLAEHYLTADFGEDAMRPKSGGTIANTQQIVRHYLIARWGNEVAGRSRDSTFSAD